MTLFNEGRKETFSTLKQHISPEDKTIWFHTASLGEFEQGLPIMEMIKKKYPNHKIVVSFFSPSGYEIKKNTSIANAVVYLPLDTPKNARKFLDFIHPELVFFVKYEFWPNILKELKKRSIRTFLISGSFRKDQVFFKPYGNWMRKALNTFEYFFVQNEKSVKLLNHIGFKNVMLSGDTRYDRVSRQLQQDNSLTFVEEFKDDKICVVAGSTWPEDEKLLVDFINNASNEIKFVIVPHTLKSEKIKKLKEKIRTRTVLFSEKQGKTLSHYQVLILDTIGLLSKIYWYADIAYVGGAIGNTGLHNILEPATFGIPIIIGNNFEKFPEAGQLQKIAGLYSVKNKRELGEILSKMTQNSDFRKKTGMIAGHFVTSNTGATHIIEHYLEEKNVK